MEARTLERYRTALRTAGAAGFDKGAQPHQDAVLLTQLRKVLIHFEPQSHHQREEEPTRFERKLSGKSSPSRGPGELVRAFGRPEWKRIDRGSVESLVGQALAE